MYMYVLFFIFYKLSIKLGQLMWKSKNLVKLLYYSTVC